MKAILIDDESLALDYLERQIQKVSDIEIKGTFTYINLKEEASLIQEIDVVFLDIEMPEITGLELADQILELNPHLMIVFVTAYPDYAVQAFELDVLDYVVKPVQSDRLKKTIQRIEQQKQITTTTTPEKPKPLCIQLCQELAFTLNDELIPVKWRTSKAQELFLYLLHHNEKTVRKEELSELLWPDFELERANSQLYTTIYHIRKTIQPFSEHISIKNIQDRYMLMIENTQIDILKWEEKLIQLSTLSERNVQAYEEAMLLYKGPYLQMYPYAWIETERYRLEQLWIKTAYQMGNYYVDQQNVDRAQSWFDQICQMRPEEEPAHLALMKLYAGLGYGIFVRQQYKKLQEALSELGVDVSPEITRWYEEWEK